MGEASFNPIGWLFTDLLDPEKVEDFCNQPLCLADFAAGKKDASQVSLMVDSQANLPELIVDLGAAQR